MSLGGYLSIAISEVNNRKRVETIRYYQIAICKYESPYFIKYIHI